MNLDCYVGARTSESRIFDTESGYVYIYPNYIPELAESVTTLGVDYVGDYTQSPIINQSGALKIPSTITQYNYVEDLGHIEILRITDLFGKVLGYRPSSYLFKVSGLLEVIGDNDNIEVTVNGHIGEPLPAPVQAEANNTSFRLDLYGSGVLQSELDINYQILHYPLSGGSMRETSNTRFAVKFAYNFKTVIYSFPDITPGGEVTYTFPEFTERLYSGNNVVVQPGNITVPQNSYAYSRNRSTGSPEGFLYYDVTGDCDATSTTTTTTTTPSPTTTTPSPTTTTQSPTTQSPTTQSPTTPIPCPCYKRVPSTIYSRPPYTIPTTVDISPDLISLNSAVNIQKFGRIHTTTQTAPPTPTQTTQQPPITTPIPTSNDCPVNCKQLKF